MMWLVLRRAPTFAVRCLSPRVAKRCWPPGPGRVAKGSLALDVVVAARVGLTDFMAQQGVATQRRERCEGESDLQPSDAAATGVLAAECSAPGSMPLLYGYRLTVEGRVLGVLELSSSEVLEATVQTPVAGQEETARNLRSRPATQRLDLSTSHCVRVISATSGGSGPRC